jgi:hypothetical protein
MGLSKLSSDQFYSFCVLFDKDGVYVWHRDIQSEIKEVCILWCRDSEDFDIYETRLINIYAKPIKEKNIAKSTLRKYLKWFSVNGTNWIKHNRAVLIDTFQSALQKKNSLSTPITKKAEILFLTAPPTNLTDENSREVSRSLLFAVEQMHKQGYEGMRVMPVWDGLKWELYIGPRIAFTKTDGAIVNTDRGFVNCLHYVEGSYKGEIADTAEKTLAACCLSKNDRRKIYIENYDTAESFWNQNPVLQNIPPLLGVFLSHCRTEDDKYKNWYSKLCDVLRQNVGSLPCITTYAVSENNYSSSFFLRLNPSEKPTASYRVLEPPPIGLGYI